MNHADAAGGGASGDDMTRESWKPKLGALDIDGTLVDHDGYLPHEIHAAVHRILDAGARVVLATGRAWAGTKIVFDALDLPPGPAVASNGAVVVQYPPMEIICEVTFEPADVIDRITEMAPRALIGIEEPGVGYRVTGEFPEGDLSGRVTVVPREELRELPATRVIVRDPNSTEPDFMVLARQLGLHGVNYFIGHSAWLDIAPEGVHKATGLARVCADLGIDRDDVLAMGDGRNDIEMLQWAGRGVAIGDAPAEVRVVADHVTGRFADGGTVRELDRWFRRPDAASAD